MECNIYDAERKKRENCHPRFLYPANCPLKYFQTH